MWRQQKIGVIGKNIFQRQRNLERQALPFKK
jgi:hypothetical protein